MALVVNSWKKMKETPVFQNPLPQFSLLAIKSPLWTIHTIIVTVNLGKFGLNLNSILL